MRYEGTRDDEFECPDCGPGVQWKLSGGVYECRGRDGTRCGFKIQQPDLWQRMRRLEVFSFESEVDRGKPRLVDSLIAMLKSVTDIERDALMSDVLEAFCRYCWRELKHRPGMRDTCHCWNDE